MATLETEKLIELDMLSEQVMSPALAKFLQTAYQLPSEIVASGIMSTETIQERSQMLVIVCFTYYLSEIVKVISVNELDHPLSIMNYAPEYWQGFLADAVMRSYCGVNGRFSHIEMWKKPHA